MQRIIERFPRAALSCLAALAVASCNGDGSDDPGAPRAPGNVRILPASGQLVVSWDPVPDATSYDVYSSSTPDVTTASTKVTTTATTQTLSGANGSVTYVAVAARNDAGQSALSGVSCGVPTPGGAPGAGFTMYAALCGATLDGALFTTPEIRRVVRNGALELEARAANIESVTLRGVRPNTTMSVPGSGATRVTTWGATIAVPAAVDATRSGTATIQAAVVLVYQPRANRLAFPGGQEKLVTVQAGLQDTGSGLRFFRAVTACTQPSCATTDTATNIAYADGTLPVDQPASYGTPYTFSLSLDEASGTFTLDISGGNLGVTTGTANASALFAAQGISPADDFSIALVRVRALDPDPAGGSSGRILARFDDVTRGTAGATPLLYDAFDAPTIDPAKWGTGEASLLMNGGALEARPSVTSSSAGFASSVVALTPGSVPTTTHRIRVDVSIPAAGPETRFGLMRALYNDGTAGTTPPDVNQANSAVGDVLAQIALTTTSARLFLFRAMNAVGGGLILTRLDAPPLPTSTTNPLGAGTTHTLAIAWDPAAHTVTFQVDDATPVTVDPTSATDPYMATPAPVVAQRPHVDSTLLTTSVSGGGTPGVSTSGTIRLNNLLVAP